MIEKIGVALPFDAFYSTFGSGQTGLTVTVDVYKNSTKIVTAASATEVGDGLYTYTLASNLNDSEGVYKAIFKTETTPVDQKHLACAWYVGKAGIEYLDASIAAVPTVGEIDAQLSGTHGAGTWGGGSGSGAIDWSDQFIVTVGGLPRDGVFVRFTTDAAMLNTVATGTTNTFGKLDALMLDAGTYYVWLQLAGVNFSQPAGTEVVA